MGHHVTKMTIYDAIGGVWPEGTPWAGQEWTGHYTREQADEIVANYPEHEREARAKGIPMLGSGRIFPVAREAVACRPFQVPDHFACLGAVDFGWDHPTAAVKLAWDRDDDIVYVVQAYKSRQQVIAVHAGALKPWGERLPWAWPHDGFQHDKQSGKPTAEAYRAAGLKMLPDKATFEDGSYGVEAGLQIMLDRMQTGRLKVFDHLEDWFAEFQVYHRKDGKVVKEYDDLMAATRYGVMMLRFARPEVRTHGGAAAGRRFRQADMGADPFGEPAAPDGDVFA